MQMAAGFMSEASLAISPALPVIVLYILIYGKQWMKHVKRYPLNISFKPTSHITYKLHITEGNFIFKSIWQTKMLSWWDAQQASRQKTGVLETKLLA